MKRLFAALAILACAAAGAATLSPIQLLNPAGSTAGQAIVSSGPGSPPAWATVSVSAPTGTLPVSNGGTGATSATTARLNLGAAATSGTLGQFAATTSAQLAGVLSDETGTGAAVFGTSPTIATPAITGVANAGNAAAGNVGEFMSVNNTTPVSLTTDVVANCATLSVTAGDWDVSGVVTFGPGAGSTTTKIIASVSTTSATTGGPGTAVVSLESVGSAASQLFTSPLVRVNVSTTTNVYLVGLATFSGGTQSCQGFMRARRMH